MIKIPVKTSVNTVIDSLKVVDLVNAESKIEFKRKFKFSQWLVPASIFFRSPVRCFTDL